MIAPFKMLTHPFYDILGRTYTPESGLLLFTGCEEGVENPYIFGGLRVFPKLTHGYYPN
jgi:hypothetical protein